MEKNRGLNAGDLSTYKGEVYGFCAVWIMLFHCHLCGVYYNGSNPVLKVMWTLINRGNMGVDIFLALSGVTLYFAYSGHEGDLGRFIKRRVIRLVLPVLLIYGGYWIWDLIRSGNVYTFLLRISTLEFWVAGKQKIWFVSFILVCYVIYPYIYTFLKGSRKRSTCTALLMIVAVMVMTYAIREKYRDFYSTYEIAMTRLPVFLLGCWAGRFVKEKAQMPRWVVPLAYLSALLCVYIYVWGTPPKSMWGRYFYMFSGAAFSLVAVHLFKNMKFGRLHCFFRFFGNISLECYLAHIMLITVYQLSPFYDEGNVWKYGLLLVLAVVIATIASKLGSIIRNKSFAM